MMTQITTVSFVVALAPAMLLPGCAPSGVSGPVVLSELSAGGDLTENADGSASFEFRVANERQDVVVTGFTVSVNFYNGAVSAENVLATYHWSFRSEVAPKGALLEYGVLDAKVVAALKKRIAAALGVAEADALSKAVYAYIPTTDTKVGVGEK